MIKKSRCRVCAATWAHTRLAGLKEITVRARIVIGVVIGVVTSAHAAGHRVVTGAECAAVGGWTVGPAVAQVDDVVGLELLGGGAAPAVVVLELAAVAGGSEYGCAEGCRRRA